MRRRRRKRKKRERRRGKRLDYYYYFAVSYKYSFLLLDESERLALQAVSRVKSANERLLQAPRREPPLGFPLPFLSLFLSSPFALPCVPFLSYEAIPRGNRAARRVARICLIRS